MFVTIEGPNGVGKTSLAKRLVEALRNMGINVIYTSEPTNSSLGQWIREIESLYKGRVYACLIAADRYFHLENEVIPALQQKKVVISDRYVESSLVLQRIDGVCMEFIWRLNRDVLIPDLSIILTAPPHILRHRLALRTHLSRFEKASDLELKYYMETADFLKERGFNVVVLDNGNTPLQYNIDKVKRLILLHLAKKNLSWGK